LSEKLYKMLGKSKDKMSTNYSDRAYAIKSKEKSYGYLMKIFSEINKYKDQKEM